MSQTTRTAFNGSARGSIVEFGHMGVWMRLRGTGEVRFIVYRHLDPVGFKPAKAARAKTTSTPKAKPTPRARKTTIPKLGKPEKIVRDQVVSDLVKHRDSLESIGKATVNK